MRTVLFFIMIFAADTRIELTTIWCEKRMAGQCMKEWQSMKE